MGGRLQWLADGSTARRRVNEGRFKDVALSNDRNAVVSVCVDNVFTIRVVY